MPTLIERMMAETGRIPSPTSTVAKALNRRGVGKSDEWHRIIALPRRVLELASVPDLTPLYRHTERCAGGCDLCADGPAKLYPEQSAALLEAEATGGAFLPLAVGTGKTLLSMLLFDAMRAKRGALFVPADVRDQLVNHDIARYGRHFRLPLDRFVIRSYNDLSDPRTPRLLYDLDIDTAVWDEAHCIRNRDSVRTRRVIGFAQERQDVMHAAMSGTFTNGSVKDYAHILAMTHRNRSPLPLDWRTLEDWASALDVDSSRIERMMPGVLLGFCTEEEKRRILANEVRLHEAARLGFSRRLTETPGVVSSSGADCGASLVLRARHVEVPPEVKKLLHRLDTTWSVFEETFEEASQMVACARQLACGFYYTWDWPGGVVDEEWLRARSAWNQAVRDQIRYGHMEGVDSPALVRRAVLDGRLPKLQPALDAWLAVEHRPQPPTKPVWVSDFLVEDAVRWAAQYATEPGGGIIWYSHRSMAPKLRAAGLRVFGEGDSAELVTLASSGGYEGAGVVACSLHAHRKGKNLQHRWSRMLFVAPPVSAEAWEQAIGRAHRNGQRMDEVEVDAMQHTEHVREAMQRAFAIARADTIDAALRAKILRARKVGIIDRGVCQNIVDMNVEDA